MPHHGHAGTELTMVLSGGYQDVTGAYARGDVATADGALVHQPIADADEACICLTVTTGMLLPTRVLGVIGQIVHRLRA
jgi:putative transcriptional regulator